MKKYLKYLIAFAMTASLFIQSCKKGVDDVNFDISYEQKSYAVGQPIVFNVAGGAELITFYSGETGKEYKYRERFEVIGGKPSMEFTSTKLYAPNDNPIYMLVSTDFSGAYNVESLDKATWTDISDRVTFSTGTADTKSGTINLSDFQKPKIPVYIAFKYVNPGVPYYAPQYVIKNFLIKNEAPDGSTPIIETTTSLDWAPISISGVRTWAYSTVQISMWGGPANTEPNEDWIISKPIQLDQVQRSFGVNVKNNPTTKLAAYEFPGFSAPGTYTVTFEAINANIDKVKKEIKQFTITVI